MIKKQIYIKTVKAALFQFPELKKKTKKLLLSRNIIWKIITKLSTKGRIFSVKILLKVMEESSKVLCIAS